MAHRAGPGQVEDFYENIMMFLRGNASELCNIEWERTDGMVDGRKMVKDLRQRFDMHKEQQHRIDLVNFVQKPGATIADYLCEVQIKYNKVRKYTGSANQQLELLNFLKGEGDYNLNIMNGSRIMQACNWEAIYRLHGKEYQTT